MVNYKKKVFIYLIYICFNSFENDGDSYLIMFIGSIYEAPLVFMHIKTLYNNDQTNVGQEKNVNVLYYFLMCILIYAY